MSSKITMRDIARAAKVSPATVSQVLNRRATVRTSTAQAVWQAAKALNYRMAPTAGMPRQSGRHHRHRTNRIVLIVAAGAFENLPPVYMSFVHGVQAAVADHSRNLLLRHADEINRAALEEFAGVVDGAVVMGVGTPALALANPGFLPYVCTLAAAPEEPLQADYVTLKNEMVGVLAAQYLLARGHRVCGVIGYGGTSLGMTQRTNGFVHTLQTGGGMACEHTIFVNGKEWRIPMEDVLARQPRPTGLFCLTDELTVALYSELFRNGIHPGRDVDVVSCNNERALIQGLNPPPGEIDIHAELIGRRAVDQLVWRLENLNAPYARIELEPALLAPAPAEVSPVEVPAVAAKSRKKAVS